MSFEPDAYLESLKPIGWRLGLERMRKLTTALGLPQHRFASIHVVGTNGKSSVTRMTAALLEAHGVTSGACLSPHMARWSERTLVHGREIGAEEWSGAVEQVARAAEAVDRSLEEGDAVTQFEAATAATFVALAKARVQAAAIEAGLGGRLDATNTIPSRVTVLTSIGRDHTEWLGESELEIAAEKLAVLRDQTTLVLGQVSPAVEELAELTAAAHGARVVRAPLDPGPELRLLAMGEFQRRNFALAMAAAEAFLGKLDPDRVRDVAATISIPGRLEQVAAEPATFLDAAHNPDGAAALAEALPALAGGKRVVACLAILRDKDAAAMVGALAPVLDRAICTQLPADGPESHAGGGFSAHRPSVPAAELALLCEGAGVAAEAEADFGRALARARALAAETPPGIVLVAGSHYGIAPAREALSMRGSGHE
ncbi:MAG TPA: cyanophycin synthetase [Solirubrobacterales bacterium]|nr:cyanophycin synthetase [Solirubrobacterales bacterium]